MKEKKDTLDFVKLGEEHICQLCGSPLKNYVDKGKVVTHSWICPNECFGNVILSIG